MKKSLLIGAMYMIFSVVAFGATAPGSLSLQGTALNESSEAMPMKLVGNTYELFTSLKTGSYSFTDSSAPGDNITVDGENVPYCIRVNYDGATPEVTIKKIENVILWSPEAQKAIGELAYDGNSTFKGIKVSADLSNWGNDNRYRIRIIFGEDFETYGNEFDFVPDDDTPASYYDMYLTQNGRWFDPDKKYKIANKYVDKFFDVEVKLPVTGNYTHIITPHQIVSDLPLADALQVEGNAVEYGSSNYFYKKEEGVFVFVGGLKQGTYKIKGTKDSQTYYYSSSLGELVEGETEFTITETEAKPYYIRVDILLKTLKISEITSCYLNYGSGSEADRIMFTYAGNGKFTAQSLITWPMATWERLDERYKFRLVLDDNSFISWGYSASDAAEPDTDMNGDYYKLHFVNNDAWAYSFKFAGKDQDKVLDLELNFKPDGIYRHSYKQADLSGINETPDSGVKVFPTMVNDIVNIQVAEEGFSVDFISLSGNCLLTKECASNILSLSDIQLAKGMYLVKITQNGKVLSTQRIIKM